MSTKQRERLPGETVEPREARRQRASERETNTSGEEPFQQCTVSPETLDEDDDPYDTHLSDSFVPSTTQRMTEQETARQSVQQ